MPFESTPNTPQSRPFWRPESARQNLETRQCGMLPLGSALGTVQINHRLGDKAPWPVWGGSTRKPVQFQPMTKRQAVNLWHDLRRFERQTREKGKQDGAIGRNGLAVGHAILFDLIDRPTGQLEPERAEIARAACISIRSVDRGLAKLKAAGVLNWIRQCAESIEDGIYRLKQKASAYFVLPVTQWLGFRRPADVPPPYPEAWGRTPPLPSPMELAGTVHAEGGSHAAQLAALACDPRDALANSVARLFNLITARKG